MVSAKTTLTLWLEMFNMLEHVGSLVVCAKHANKEMYNAKIKIEYAQDICH